MTTRQATPVHHSPDERDRELLNALQSGVPLSRTPYREIGARIEMDEEDVLARVERLKQAGLVRQTSAIFDTRTLGYSSALVAAAYPDERLFDAAALIGGHPGVSHNYRRSHRFNLWFTIAVEHESRIGLDETIELLAERTAADSMRSMPTLKLFKINVQLDMKGDAGASKEVAPPPPKREGKPLPTEHDKRFIRILQRDLPVVSRPFDLWADQAGVAADDILAEAARFQELGYMRRFAGLLNHRKAGFGANGMAVWKVPEERIEELGPRMAAFSAVSHCYRRPTYPDWPYSLFTMVHARSKESCEETIAAIGREIGFDRPDQRAVLYSTYEFKKIRLVYFTPEYDRWERAALAGEELPRW